MPSGVDLLAPRTFALPQFQVPLFLFAFLFTFVRLLMHIHLFCNPISPAVHSIKTFTFLTHTSVISLANAEVITILPIINSSY